MTDILERLHDLWLDRPAGIFEDAAAEITRLRAEIAEHKAAKWIVQHQDTMNEIVQMGMANDEALAELAAVRAERDGLRTAALALKDDMLERARLHIDVIYGEQCRIVNAGRSAWADFCAALEAPK